MALGFFERTFKVNERLGIKERVNTDSESIKRIKEAMGKRGK
ncbi:MAG: hypothetical protein ABIJ37_09815 [Pseudomonadota bacterium]